MNNDIMDLIDDFGKGLEIVGRGDQNVRSRMPTIQARFARMFIENGFDKYDEKKVKTLLGRKWRICLELLGAFIDEYKYLTSRKYISEIYVSTHSPNLTEIFKGPVNVSRVIKYALDVGLILCTDEVSRYGKDAKARMYIWNKKAQDAITKVIESNGINVVKQDLTLGVKSVMQVRKWIQTNKVPKSVKDKAKVIAASSFSCRISSRLRIPNKIHGQAVTEEDLIYYLNVRYPQLRIYQDLCDELNQTYIEDDIGKITFVPSFHWSSSRMYLSKIGIRSYNRLCAFETDERDLYLRKHLGEDYVEYDVNGSVYRLTKLINEGVFEPNDGKDVYAVMFGGDDASHTQLTPERRDTYKKILMRLYFDYPRKAFKNMRDIFSHVDRTRLPAYESLLAHLRQCMIQYTGRTLDSEVFLHESCIYLDFYHELCKRYGKVYQVYDCVFLRQDPSVSREEMLKQIGDVLQQCGLAYYERFIS